jgi:hypothetical protein
LVVAAVVVMFVGFGGDGRSLAAGLRGDPLGDLAQLARLRFLLRDNKVLEMTFSGSKPK